MQTSIAFPAQWDRAPALVYALCSRVRRRADLEPQLLLTHFTNSFRIEFALGCTANSWCAFCLVFFASLRTMARRFTTAAGGFRVRTTRTDTQRACRRAVRHVCQSIPKYAAARFMEHCVIALYCETFPTSSLVSFAMLFRHVKK